MPLLTSESQSNWIIFIFFAVLQFSPFILLGATWLIGRTVERKHLRNIAERESQWKNIPATNLKTLTDHPAVASSEMATGSVVISIDHFKRFLSSFRKIFGGEMKSYASVIERGRREAILRMKESCPDADLFLNCRIETSTISNGAGKATGCSEVLAYGTAVRFKK
mgnify:CR=1 FL=1